MNKLLPIACLALIGAGNAAAAGQVEAGLPPETARPDAAFAGPQADDNAPASRKRTLDAAPRRPAQDAADSKMQQVTVSGARSNETDQRRLSTASKMVFGREELDRNGDTSVGDILKRLPGVTTGGAPGRGGGVRMRGLGNGYTQMLVNGERPPPGFSLESLPPEQVERIEVMRGPVAEHSTQAIAGTINIVLREGYQQKDIQVRGGLTVTDGLASPGLSVGLPGKAGNLTWLLNANLMQNRSKSDTGTLDRDTGEDGGVLREQFYDGVGESRWSGIHLSPRLSYKFENNDTLNFQPFIMANRGKNGSRTEVARLAGAAPLEYALQHHGAESSSTVARAFGNWLRRLEGGAKLDVKFSGGVSNSDNSAQRRTWDEAGQPKRVFNDSSETRHKSGSSGGKYTTPIGQGHTLALGWDLEAGRLEQTSVAEDDGGALFEDSGANLAADTRRVALFAQDEWDITERWSMYFGLRWEGIRTTSTGGDAEVKNTSSVFSPVLHTVWRIPGREKDQLRASFTQSYRAAPLGDMIAAPSFSTDNRRVRPDRVGNPDLKPELAKGIDLAYEHYVGKSGIVSASGFVRDIDNLLRRETTLRQSSLGPRWVSSPSNIGKARATGIELEAKFPLTDLFAAAPNIDLRSNYSRFWSNVDGIPGPSNRLDGQAEQTANLGLDYRMKARPLTLGGSFNWTPDSVVRTSLTEQASSGRKRQLDLYGLWKFSANTQLRLSANNLLGEDYENGRIASNLDRDLMSTAARTYTSTVGRSYTTVGLRFETKL